MQLRLTRLHPPCRAKGSPPHTGHAHGTAGFCSHIHTSQQTLLPCAQPCLSPPRHLQKSNTNSQVCPRDNHSRTRLGDTRGFAEPLKAPGHSFSGGNVPIGRVEPPVTGARLPDRPAPTCPAQVSFSWALFALPAAWLSHRSCTFPGTDVIRDTPAGLPPVGTGCGVGLAWGMA